MEIRPGNRNLHRKGSDLMDKNIFKNPRDCKALDEAQSPFWFWNDKLEDGEILRQLELMDAAGVKCATPHARSGYIGDYMTEEWFGRIQTVIDYKKAHDEPMWLYDEFNWPAGSCNGEVSRDEHLRERYLYFTRYDVPAGQLFHAQLKPFGVSGRPEGDFDSLPKNIFCYDAGTMEQLPLTPYLQPMVIKHMDIPMKDFCLLRDRDTVVFQVQLLIDPYDEGGRGEPNYLKAEATEKFIGLTYEKYNDRFPGAFGSTIKAVFNDETRFAHSFPWTEQLPEKFLEMKGYDIRTKLPDLVLPGDEAGRTRVDYYDVIAQLYKENYHGKLRDWCEAHGTAYTAHLLGEETIAGHARYSGDFMRQMDATTRPGVDHLGKGIGSLNVKFAASAGECYGKEGLQVEVFAGCGWDLSFEEYLRMVSWMYLQGVKTIVNHGFFYSTRDERANDWPPSEFFQWAHWDRMPEANGMNRRMYMLLTGGRPEKEVLIYHPQESFWLHFLSRQGYQTMYQRGPLVLDERAAEIDQKEQLLLTGLQEQNIDFTVVPGDAVRLFKTEGGKLINTRTGAVYTTFVLPMGEVVPLTLARLLDQFAREGGNLCLMDTMPRYGMSKAEDKEVETIFENLKNSGCLAFVNDGADADTLGVWLQAVAPAPIRIEEGNGRNVNNHRYYPRWIVDPIMHNDEDLTGVSYIRYRKEDKREYLFVNFGEGPETLTVTVPSASVPEVWNTFTGEIAEAETVWQGNGAYTVRFTLPANVGVCLMTEVE